MGFIRMSIISFMSIVMTFLVVNVNTIGAFEGKLAM